MAAARNSDGDDSAARTLRALERGATTLGITIARSLHGRWRRMPAAHRERLARIADDVKQRALDARGEPDQAAAGQELRAANEKLADAIVESAAADPDVSEVEVRDLRADLARELERLSEGEIRASRGSGDVAGGTRPADGGR
jgi:hypothetical protein